MVRATGGHSTDVGVRSPKRTALVQPRRLAFTLTRREYLLPLGHRGSVMTTHALERAVAGGDADAVLRTRRAAATATSLRLGAAALLERAEHVVAPDGGPLPVALRLAAGLRHAPDGAASPRPCGSTSVPTSTRRRAGRRGVPARQPRLVAVGHRRRGRQPPGLRRGARRGRGLRRRGRPGRRVGQPGAGLRARGRPRRQPGGLREGRWRRPSGRATSSPRRGSTTTSARGATHEGRYTEALPHLDTRDRPGRVGRRPRRRCGR